MAKSNTVLPKTRKPALSSTEARKLIASAVKRYKSEVKAARALGLPNQAQLSKMRRGLIRDTPAMKAALVRARSRARRAFLLVPPPKVDQVVDPSQLKVVLHDLDRMRSFIKSILPPPKEGA